MSTIIDFEFKVDQNNSRIEVQREFEADIDMVWAAWIQPELLDQWWGATKP